MTLPHETGDRARHARPLRARLITGMQGQLVITALILFASFAAQVGIARRFAFRGLGEYTGTTIAIFLISVIAISGFPLAAGERVARHLEGHAVRRAHEAASTGFALVAAASFLAGLAAWALWDQIAGVLNLQDPVPGGAVAVAIVAAGINGYVQPVFLARLRLATVGLVAIAQPFAVVACLAFDTVRPGIFRPGAMAVVGSLAAGTVAIACFVIGGDRQWPASREVRPMIRQALHSLPLVYISSLQSWVNRLLVSVILGTAALGVYQGTSALVEGVLRLPGSANSFLVSAYARVSVADLNRVRDLVSSHLRLGTMYVAVLGASLIAGADGLLVTMFGAGSLPATPTLRILAVGLVPGLLLVSLATATTGSGALRAATNVGRVVVPAQVVLMLLLAPPLGVEGAALANVAALALSAADYAWTCARAGTILPAGAIARSVALGATTCALGLLVGQAPAHWIVRAVVAGAGAGALAAALILGPADRSLLASLVRRQGPGRDAGAAAP